MTIGYVIIHVHVYVYRYVTIGYVIIHVHVYVYRYVTIGYVIIRVHVYVTIYTDYTLCMYVTIVVLLYSGPRHFLLVLLTVLLNLLALFVTVAPRLVKRHPTGTTSNVFISLFI